MKAYVLTTGVIFGLISVAHFLRFYFEPHLATDPVYILLTVIAVGLYSWAGYLIRAFMRA